MLICSCISYVFIIQYKLNESETHPNESVNYNCVFGNILYFTHLSLDFLSVKIYQKNWKDDKYKLESHLSISNTKWLSNLVVLHVLMMVKYDVQIDNASKKKETIPFIGMYKGKINSTFRT